MIAFLLVCVAVLSRLVAHGWNFTAMGAVALTAGLIFSHRLLSLSVVMSALLISDAVIGFHNVMLAVYLGYVLMAVTGMYFLKSKTLKTIFTSSLIGSLLFFIASNLGVWLEGQLYPQTFYGLVNCFEMAIPFFRNEILSNLLLTPVLFYSFSFLKQRLQKSTRIVDMA